MWPWGVFYGLLTAGAVAIAYNRRRRSEDALGAALVLAFTWLISNLSHLLVHEPYNTYFPAMDAAVAMAFAWGWRNRLTPWKVALILLFVTEGGAHIFYFNSHAQATYARRYAYDLILNIIYLLQLACVVLGCALLEPLAA